MTNGNKLFCMIPPIKRCRDYHLYDYKGNRYLDMALDNGRALMGHKPGKAMLSMKNSLEKGLWASYPSIYEHRLKKLLGNVFPQFSFFTFFANEERANKIYLSSPGERVIWLPLGSEEQAASDILMIKPLLPGIQTVILASQKEMNPGDTIPPFILEGLIRNFYDFLSFREKLDLKIWDKFDQYGEWERQGPSLLFKGSRDEYEKIFTRGLENRIILPSSSDIPVFIPSQLSTFEIKCIHKAFTRGETL